MHSSLWPNLLVAVPLLGALASLALRRRAGASYVAGLVTMGVETVLAVLTALLYNSGLAGASGFDFASRTVLSAPLGLAWDVSIDGISLFLVVLSSFTTFLALAGARETRREASFVGWLLALTAFAQGSFVSHDLLLFFLFFEATLVPSYFLVSQWGGAAVHICTLDSTPTALLQRLLASLCEVDSGRLVSSRLTAEEWPRLGEAIAQLSAAPLFFSDQAINTVASIRAHCQELAAQRSEPLGLVVIDALQLLCGDPAEQLKDLRLLAAELGACVLLTCQSRPSVELRPGGLPLLHDLPALEAMQTYPHVIAMLHREEFWDPDTSRRGEAQLLLVKNSDNPLGTLRFGFEPEFSRFLGIDAP